MLLLKKTTRFLEYGYGLMLAALGLCWIVLPSAALAAKLQMAPENPAFTEYLQKKEWGLLQTLSDDGYPLSFMPSPVKRPPVAARALLTANNDFPAAFDLRTVAGVTAVKDQGACGSCWAFATFASLESFLKYRHAQHKTFNFSEADLIQNSGFDYGECEGGTFDMATAYLARWDGPVHTSDVPYPYAASALQTVQATNGVKVRKHVQNVWYLPERNSLTDNAEVKAAVKTHGAVGVSFYYASAYYNSTNAAYYYDGTSSANHAVAIVGWDDDYAAGNFFSSRQPPGNGAFIVKNSWGTSWGEGGYFYLSYYDRSLSVGVCFHNAAGIGNYKSIYSHDPLGWTTSVGYGSTTAWFANVFEAGATASSIKAVSFYSPVPKATYTITLYRDVTGTNPTNGTLVKTLSGTLGKAGYRTIKTFKATGAAPTVKAGANFSVVVKLTTPGYLYPIAVEKNYTGYSSSASASNGQSYVSADGKSWNDLTRLRIGYTTLEKTNVCLKAFGG